MTKIVLVKKFWKVGFSRHTPVLKNLLMTLNYMVVNFFWEDKISAIHDFFSRLYLLFYVLPKIPKTVIVRKL